MIKPPLDVAAAGRLASRIRLRDIVCVGLEAKHLPTPTMPEERALGWETPTIQVLWEIEGSLLKVIVPFSLFIDTHQNGDDSEKTRVAEIGVAMRLEYEIADVEALGDGDLPHYVGVTSYLHAWPYFRAEVQWLSTKLGFPPLVLPTIVSGHAAQQVAVVRLRDLKAAPPLPRRKARTKAKTKAT